MCSLSFLPVDMGGSVRVHRHFCLLTWEGQYVFTVISALCSPSFLPVDMGGSVCVHCHFCLLTWEGQYVFTVISAS